MPEGSRESPFALRFTGLRSIHRHGNGVWGMPHFSSLLPFGAKAQSHLSGDGSWFITQFPCLDGRVVCRPTL